MTTGTLPARPLAFRPGAAGGGAAPTNVAASAGEVPVPMVEAATPIAAESIADDVPTVPDAVPSFARHAHPELAALSQPPPERFSDLQAQLRGREVVVIRPRDGVIRYTALAAVGGSLLINLGLLGSLLWLCYRAYPVIVRVHDISAIEIIDGGEGRAVQVADTPGLAVTHDAQPESPATLAPSTPDVAALLTRHAPAADATALLQPSPASALPTALPEAPRFHKPSPAVTSDPVAPAPKPVEVPAPVRAGVASAAPTGSPAAAANRSTGSVGSGSGGGEEGDDDEFAMMKSGVGTGRGKGRGSGWDRGPSAADNPEPGILYNPLPEVPLGVALSGARPKEMVFEVTIRPDGSAGEVKLVQSSGYPELDDLYRNALAHTWKYRAAYKAGRPIAATKIICFR